MRVHWVRSCIAFLRGSKLLEWARSYVLFPCHYARHTCSFLKNHTNPIRPRNFQLHFWLDWKLCLKFVNATSYQIDVGYLPRYENSKVIIGRWGKMRPRSLPTKIKSGRPRLQYAGGSAVIAKLELSCDSIRLSEWCLADGALKTCFISVIWISITHFHPSNAIYWEQLREEVSHVSPHAHREMGVVSVITILWHSVGGGRARGRRPIPSSSSVEILPWDLYEALVYRVEKKGL